MAFCMPVAGPVLPFGAKESDQGLLDFSHVALASNT